MNETRILAHRGASAEAPENTLRAFELAAEQGADGIELDVQPSADGVLVIMHDETVDRTTNGRGRVADLPYATLAGLDAGSGERVPTLAEALRQARGRLFVDIEIKDLGIEAAVAELVDQLDMAEQVAISSFHLASLAAMRVAAPRLPRWLLSASWSPSLIEAARDLGAVGVAPDYRQLDAAAVALARASRLSIVTWTVNSEAEIERLYRLGVDVLITDIPARALRLRSTMMTDDGG